MTVYVAIELYRTCVATTTVTDASAPATNSRRESAPGCATPTHAYRLHRAVESVAAAGRVHRGAAHHYMVEAPFIEGRRSTSRARESKLGIAWLSRAITDSSATQEDECGCAWRR